MKAADKSDRWLAHLLVFTAGLVIGALLTMGLIPVFEGLTPAWEIVQTGPRSAS